MRSWALVLHFYQPPTQNLSVTGEILTSCYLPVLRALVANPQAKITFNISGSLILQLKELGAEDFFVALKALTDRGQVELLNSPIYHPLMPLTPAASSVRQLQYNREVLLQTCGKEPTGFFPPELAVNEDILREVAKAYPFAIVDQSSLSSSFDINVCLTTPVYDFEGIKLIASQRMLTEFLRSYPGNLLKEKVQQFVSQCEPDGSVFCCATDVEVFGHHYQERLELFGEITKDPEFEFITCSELVNRTAGIKITKIVPSTWQTSPEQLANHNSYPLWQDPGNQLQKEYFDLTNLAKQALEESRSTQQDDPGMILSSARKHYDMGTSSCHLYWLSNWPWWHPDLAQAGATSLVKCIRTLPCPPEMKRQGENLYHSLLREIWEYHWSGKVQEKWKAYDLYHEKFVKNLPQ